MEIRVIAFGIAKEIIRSGEKVLDIGEGSSIGDVRKKLVSEYPEFEKLRSLKFAVNEEYRPDEFDLKPSDELIIIPPVSGG